MAERDADDADKAPIHEEAEVSEAAQGVVDNSASSVTESGPATITDTLAQPDDGQMSDAKAHVAGPQASAATPAKDADSWLDDETESTKETEDRTQTQPDD